MYLHSLKRPIWSALERGGDEAVTAAAAHLTARGMLVSFFEARSCADVELVAVALAATRESGHFDFIAIATEDLDAIGIPTHRSEGRTPLPAANRLHVDLDLAGDRAHRLVEHLRDQGVRASRIRKEQLRDAARKLWDAGHPIPDDCWLLR